MPPRDRRNFQTIRGDNYENDCKIHGIKNQEDPRMRIQQFVNGKWTAHSGLNTARTVASYLRSFNWQVWELYEIGMLILFTPGYGEITLNDKEENRG